MTNEYCVVSYHKKNHVDVMGLGFVYTPFEEVWVRQGRGSVAGKKKPVRKVMYFDGDLWIGFIPNYKANDAINAHLKLWDGIVTQTEIDRVKEYEALRKEDPNTPKQFKAGDKVISYRWDLANRTFLVLASNPQDTRAIDIESEKTLSLQTYLLDILNE